MRVFNLSHSKILLTCGVGYGARSNSASRFYWRSTGRIWRTFKQSNVVQFS
nr:hypothetical protein [Leptospira interrogans]